MIGALVYLQFTSLKNAVRRRLQRLRQPRYLVATVVSLAYFYYFFFRRTRAHGAHPGPEVMPVEVGLLSGLFMMVLLMVGVLLGALRLHLKGKKAERELKYLA